ncbi:MAG: glycosyltransferase family 9 protein [Endomicrobiaceae bacterium]
MKNIINSFVIFILNLITDNKNKNFDLKKSKNILFVRFDNKVGDTVVDTFFIKGLRTQTPDAKITVLIRKPYNELLEGNKDIDEIIALPNKKYMQKSLKMILKLRKNKYDTIIDIPYNLSMKRIIFYSIINPKAMVAVNNCKYTFITHALKTTDVFKYNKHISVLYASIVSMFGNKSYEKKYFLFPSQKNSNAVNLFLESKNIQGKKLLFFNTEGSCAERSLSNKKTIDLLELIINNFYDLKIVLSVFTKNIDIPVRKEIFVYKADSLMSLVGMVKTSNYILTPDTGIVHIADAFNKPMVTLNWEKTPFIFLSKNDMTIPIMAPYKKDIEYIDNSKIIDSLKKIIC